MQYIHLVAAARPNFMKIAPLYHALKKEDWAMPIIVHTGQHYDWNMSDVFFQELGLPEPDIHLGVGSGSHAQQTGQVMIAYEKILIEKHPDLVVVVGDVNSTVAATLAATKLGIKVAHLEAGLRSYDRSMPEEINRVVTDALADLLWTPSIDGDENLKKEGLPQNKICRVGNIMIDSLEMMKPRILKESVIQELGIGDHHFGIVTLHRPSNVDDANNLKHICQILLTLAGKFSLIFAIHPRTRKNLEKNNLMSMLQSNPSLHLLDPQSYIRFMNLVFHCKFVITDSGGIQEETSYLGIPCLTLRQNTERPITITHGTNCLCKLEQLVGKVDEISYQTERKTIKIDLWDGHTANRVVESIRKFLE